MRKSTIDKDSFLNKLRGNLERATEADWDSFLMFYSGHGNPGNGAWVVTLWEDQPTLDLDKTLITLDEVL